MASRHRGSPYRSCQRFQERHERVLAAVAGEQIGQIGPPLLLTACRAIAISRPGEPIGSRGGRRCEERYLGLDHVDQLWLELDRLEEKGLKLIAAETGEHVGYRLAFLDFRGSFAGGQERRDDVLAPAAA